MKHFQLASCQRRLEPEVQRLPLPRPVSWQPGPVRRRLLAESRTSVQQAALRGTADTLLDAARASYGSCWLLLFDPGPPEPG